MFELNKNIDFPDFLPGHVWLVGSGPGDVRLLSLMACHAINQADVVVYDALVGDEILDYISEHTQMIYAGKRGGKPSATQNDISLRLVELAQEGKRVLRLKGGDPFVFGRGGEEALTLVRHNVPFRVVPGISAGIGALCYAGIPVTHRDTNSAVLFLTGHNAKGVVPDSVEWEAISKAAPVLVFYMALKHLEEIAEKLIAAGRDPNQPVALVSNATTPHQKECITTLSRCYQDANLKGIEPPAIVVVGEVVRLKEGLDWAAALAGKTLNPEPLGEPIG